jgi:hypothetical protein
MQAHKWTLAAILLLAIDCTLVLAARPNYYDEDKLMQFHDIVFARGGQPVDFTRIAMAMNEIVFMQSERATFKSGTFKIDKASPQLEYDLVRLLQFRTRTSGCEEKVKDIAEYLDKFWEFRTNLIPYLWHCQELQYSYCNGKSSPNYRDWEEIEASKQLEADNSDLDSLARKLDLPELKLPPGASVDDRQQVERVLATPTIRKALHVQHAAQSDSLLTVYRQPAMRQVLVELRAAEFQDGHLSEPLKALKKRFSSEVNLEQLVGYEECLKQLPPPPDDEQEDYGKEDSGKEDSGNWITRILSLCSGDNC